MLGFVCLCLCMAFFTTQAQTHAVQVYQNGSFYGGYPSLVAAWAALPNPITSPMQLEMTSLYGPQSDSLPLSLGPKTGASQVNTITIRPALGVDSIVHAANLQAGVSLLVLDGADHVVLDGRPGGQGIAGVWTLRAISVDNNTLALINGAQHNVIQYLRIQNAGTAFTSRGLLLGTSPNDASGNSFNLVQYCIFQGARTPINNNGSLGNPNRKNVIRANEISTVYFAGIWVQPGHQGITIDSNVIHGNHAVNGAVNGILFAEQADTAIISNNHIYNLTGLTSGGSVVGVHIQSTRPAMTNNLTFIFNNLISLSLPNNGTTYMAGIEYGANAIIQARVYHNTVRIGGTLTSTATIGTIASACFHKNSGATNSNNSFDLRNNIFINARTGGHSTAQHIGAAFISLSGSNQLNYNTYHVTGPVGRTSATAHTTLSAFGAAFTGGNEAQGNTRAVQTLSNNDLRLDGTSLGDSLLGALPLTAVRFDVLGTLRNATTVYRGAHEPIPQLGPHCSGRPTIGSIGLSRNNLCVGDTFTLALANSINPLWTYQWQWALAGSTQFTNLTGVMQSAVQLQASQAVQYRCIARCQLSNSNDTSNVVQLQLLPSLGLVDMVVSPGAFTYTFEAVTGPNVSNLLWDFDDGSTDTGRVVSYTFTANRQYRVRLYASNPCFIDSVVNLVNIVGLGSPAAQSTTFRIWPNPAKDHLWISSSGDIYKVVIINMQGVVLRTWEQANPSPWYLSLEGLAAANYQLQCFDKGGRRYVHMLSIYH